MQEIAKTLGLVLEHVKRVDSRLQSLEERLLGRARTNDKRREQYAEAKRIASSSRIALPERHVLRYKDKRLDKKVCEWAAAGMRFWKGGRKGDAAFRFIAYTVHAWNACTYLKKPITFSGSSFRIWKGTHRENIGGPRDLLHFSNKKKSVLLRDSAEYTDFKLRPFWDWYRVMYEVYSELLSLGLPQQDEFANPLKLLAGGLSQYEVLPGVFWDFYETRENLNRMLKVVGPDLVRVQKAVLAGLRVTTSEPPFRPPAPTGTQPPPF